MQYDTGASRWGAMCGKRNAFMKRCEQYAAYTIPKVCLPDGTDQSNYEMKHDYQSLGAQGVNHVVNKMHLALFAPSRPFFRLDPGDELTAALAEQEYSEDEIGALLSVAERKAMAVLDQQRVRPVFYEGLKHLVITGNFLLIEGKDKLRVLGLKNYCVTRGADGTVLEILTKETIPFASLAKEVQPLVAGQRALEPDEPVDYYRWIRKLNDGRFHETQWAGDIRLPPAYDSTYTADKMPYHPITWDLASGDHYGTGLVEDYAGDFAALSMLSEATVYAAILASEFRWLVNPAGSTKAADFAASRNGDALPGAPGDINLVTSGKGNDLQVNLSVAQMYVERIGKGFMMQSSVTRQAERVTAEEIRLVAEELETSLGGGYSRVAVDLQVPVARWLMNKSGQKIAGMDIKPTIITGLDALSRSGDRDQLALFLQDCSLVDSLGPALQQRIKIAPIFAAFAAARGVSASSYLYSEEEVAAAQQQQQEAAIQQQIALAQAGVSPEGA